MARYYRTQCGTTYRPMVVLWLTTQPTIALSRGITVVSTVLATVLLWRGTTVPSTVLPPYGSTVAYYQAHYRSIQRECGSGYGSSHGNTVERYYRPSRSRQVRPPILTPPRMPRRYVGAEKSVVC